MPPPPPDPSQHEPLREPRWRAPVCLFILLTGLQVAVGPRVRLSQWQLTDSNSAVAEGNAWLSGRLDIPQPGKDVDTQRMFDTAAFRKKCYNVFPPLVAFLTVALSPLHKLLLGRADLWLPWPYILLCALPLPVLAFRLFRRESADSAWGALLAASFIAGTALLPALWFSRLGRVVFLNHVLSQIGLLILAWDLLGPRRLWPALFGLAIAAWSRQLTLLYALPLLWLSWKQKRLPLALVGVLLVIAPLLTLNYLKFGNPLDSGYQYIYVNRPADDWFAQRARRYGLFSPRFIPENAWYMHACPPRLIPTMTSLHIEGNPSGTSIWATTPLLLLTLLAAREWWRDPARRGLMLASLTVMFGALCYHTTGLVQPGCHRFALDFIPIWFAVIAPFTRRDWRAWFTVGCTAWSMLYFSLIPYS